MNALDILTAVEQGEADDWEFKSAKGGIPGSLWETYSAMANTQGGVIVLGVDQQGDAFWISGVDNLSQKQKNIWDSLHDPKRVNINLLSAADVQVNRVEGKSVIVIQVPRAQRRQRPVYVGQNPLDGTFRRDHEGDYHCSREEVGRMLADQSPDPPDSVILPFLRQEHLDQNSVQQYRNRFASRDPSHPWLALNPLEFLERLGAWRRDLRTGEEGVTFAGILMFGKDEIIARPEVLPGYHVDYREPSDNPSERWSDRLYPDGKWVANLFQFFYECLPRLYRGLQVPFQLRDLTRIDETPAHVAIREALVNALVHADYAGRGGVIVTKTRDRITLENPGILLVSYDQLQKGGVSECRNPSLQTMFGRLGMSEKAGSGMDRIREGTRYLHALPISVKEVANSVQGGNRVQVVFPFASMLPADSVAHLEKLFHAGLDSLSPGEKTALVIADIEGEVSNQRLQLMSDAHPVELTKTLQRLVAGGFLVAYGHGRGKTYHLLQNASNVGSASHNVGSHEPSVGSRSPHSKSSVGSIPGPANVQVTDDIITQLHHVAYPVGVETRLTKMEMREAILRVCSGRFLTTAQLGQILNRDPHGVRDRYLTPLVREGVLKTMFPNNPNHSQQAYRTAQNLFDEHDSDAPPRTDDEVPG